MKYNLVKDGVVENVIEVAEGQFTYTHIEHIDGSLLPTIEVDGKMKLANVFLVPEGYTLETYVEQTPEPVEEIADPQ